VYPLYFQFRDEGGKGGCEGKESWGEDMGVSSDQKPTGGAESALGGGIQIVMSVNVGPSRDRGEKRGKVGPK